MLTPEQIEKAKIALNINRPIEDDFKKQVAFSNYKTALKWVSEYNLPYRISMDYLKNYSKQYVHINPCYPYPGYPISKLMHLRQDEFSLHNPSDTPTENGYQLNLTPIEPSKRQQINELCESLRPWNLSTAAGRKQWEYYFAHFFYTVNFDEYKTFDYFGRPQREKGDNDKIAYWKLLQASVHITPERYMEEEPLATDYDLTEYSLMKFVPDWEDMPMMEM